MSAPRTVLIYTPTEVLEILAQELSRGMSNKPVSWLQRTRASQATSVVWTPAEGLRCLRRALGRRIGTTVTVRWVDEPWGEVRASWVTP
jgi:hypothetical protein